MIYVSLIVAVLAAILLTPLVKRLAFRIGAVAFGFIGGYSGAQFVLFIIVLMGGILGSLILGSTIGIFAKNSMSSAGLVLPVSMITAFLPMIASFNETFESISRFLYTQQINYLIADLSIANFTFERFIIIFSQ